MGAVSKSKEREPPPPSPDSMTDLCNGKQDGGGGKAKGAGGGAGASAAHASPSEDVNSTQVVGLGETTVLGTTDTTRAGERSVPRALAENDRIVSNRKSGGGSNNAGLNFTVADLKAGRETRAGEALKIKDQQLRILQAQNTSLLGNLDTLEEEAARIQQERLVAEDENRTLREGIFEAQSRARAATSTLKKAQQESSDKDKQVRILTDQNSELLRLLEAEEATVGKLTSDREVAISDVEALRAKYANLLTTAKQHEELAVRATREGQIRAEEVRVLKAEADQLRTTNAELRMKTQVELESLQEALRVRKEKQYQLLERLQGQESVARQSEDQVMTMEEKLRAALAKGVELDTQLQVEAQRRKHAEDTGHAISMDLESERKARQELQARLSQADEERMRMEAEARDAGEQLREMAEKVFQLLERLKLAEMAKAKSLEALRFKDSELAALKKKNERLVKESVREGRSRVKAEMDVAAAHEQIAALKKANAQLSAKCRDEAKSKLREHEERMGTEEKVRTLGGRLSFLLNKMQSDEESKVIMQEEARKMDAQLKSLNSRIAELQKKLDDAGESNRIVTQALRLKQGELEELTVKYNALKKHVGRKGAGLDNGTSSGGSDEARCEPDSDDVAAAAAAAPADGGSDLGPLDPETIKDNKGKGVFLLENKPTQGLILIRGRRPAYREWMEKRDVNGFLRKAQRMPQRFKEVVIEKLCQTLALLMAEEMLLAQVEASLEQRGGQLRVSEKKAARLEKLLAAEEDAKRRTLLRYIHAVKLSAGVEGGKACIITLPEAGVADEETHAIAALLRGSTDISELNLRGNSITDEGARALAAVLCGKSSLRSVDLRNNLISKQGVRALAEALERSDRVRHVYVHAGGKIEALGTNVWETSGKAEGEDDDGNEGIVPLVTVETVCVVDVRQNKPANANSDDERYPEGNSLQPAPIVALSLGRKGGESLQRNPHPKKKTGPGVGAGVGAPASLKSKSRSSGRWSKSITSSNKAWATRIRDVDRGTRGGSLSPVVSRSQELATGGLPGIGSQETRAGTTPRTGRP